MGATRDGTHGMLASNVKLDFFRHTGYDLFLLFIYRYFYKPTSMWPTVHIQSAAVYVFSIPVRHQVCVCVGVYACVSTNTML